MDIVKICLFALVALFVYLIFKGRRDDVAVFIPIVAGALIFIALIPQISSVISFMKNLASKANIDTMYIGTVMKIIAIAYIASFCSELCKDAGSGSLASKIEFSGKILILVLAVPILMAVLDSILKIM